MSGFASTFRNRNRTPFRSRGRGGGQWTPAHLGLYALYDYRASTSTTMVDQSGNGVADATVGGGSNSPLWLPHTVPQVYFPGSAGNTVSCTAPAGAASYSAQPVGGGAPTTGVAASGAFSFGASNAGAWESVSILDAGAVEIAKFQASSSTQTGHTDAYAVAWTVNRAASGRKTVVQSPAAQSANGVWLGGTDDKVDVPAAALPPLGTADSATLIWVGRIHATPIAFGAIFVAGTTGNDDGIYLWCNSNNTFDARLGEAGGAAYVTTASAPFVLGKRVVLAVKVNARTAMTLQVNNDSPVSVSTATVGAVTNRAGTLLSHFGGLPSADAECEAWATVSRPLSATEIAQMVAFYGGGL